MSPRPPLRGKKAMTLTAFRLPVELVQEIDRHAKRLTDETGIAVQRAEAARLLLLAGIRSESSRSWRETKREVRKGR